MKTIKILFFSVALVFAGSAAFAQNANHSHKAPHGGVVQEANGYHIEMVKTKDTLNFFLLDANGKAVTKTPTGKIEYEFTNKTKSTSDLTSGKAGNLRSSIPKANIFEYCTVTLKVDGKTVSSKFKNTVTDADRAHGHQH
jgi:hypothetical protein